MAGLQLDLVKLTRLGLEGLESLLRSKLEHKESDQESQHFFRSGFLAIERFRYMIQLYLQKVETLPESENKNALKQALEGNLSSSPQTFHQALQLVLLSSTITNTLNFGRLDVTLGPFLQKDLNSNTLNWERAKSLMVNFYQIIEEEMLWVDGRFTIGGMGRENIAEADLFAKLAMEVTHELNLPMPQLTLRFHEGQNHELLDYAYEVIGAGKTYPLLYNDDVNVPAVMRSFEVDASTAEQYLPYSCGEYIIDHKSCGTPNAVINLAKALESAMNHGKSWSTGDILGPDLGGLEQYESFEALWEAYDATVKYFCLRLGYGQDSIYKTLSQHCPFSMISLLYDDCIERGRPLLRGGIRYLGGTCETYGNINTADSLTAIRHYIYEKKCYLREELLHALTSNWMGHEKMKKDFVQAPKYGNDHDVADAMAERVHQQICETVKCQKDILDIHHFLVVVINNSYNTTWGQATSASADGRLLGEALAPANAPSGGRDRMGPTAVLNSQAKLDPGLHAGAVQNLKLNSDFPKKQPLLYKSLLSGYFKNGGAQLMITVTNREDLLAAKLNPEKYTHLMVRVGGFSARFVDLEEPVQIEILSRMEHKL